MVLITQISQPSSAPLQTLSTTPFLIELILPFEVTALEQGMVQPSSDHSSIFGIINLRADASLRDLTVAVKELCFDHKNLFRVGDIVAGDFVRDVPTDIRGYALKLDMEGDEYGVHLPLGQDEDIQRALALLGAGTRKGHLVATLEKPQSR